MFKTVKSNGMQNPSNLNRRTQNLSFSRNSFGTKTSSFLAVYRCGCSQAGKTAPPVCSSSSPEQTENKRSEMKSRPNRQKERNIRPSAGRGETSRRQLTSQQRDIHHSQFSGIPFSIFTGDCHITLPHRRRCRRLSLTCTGIFGCRNAQVHFG